MRLLPLLAAAGLLALMAGCTEPAAPPPRSVPSPVPVPAPAPLPTTKPLAADWRDWPLTPGTWAYRQDGRGSIALFGLTGADAVLTLRCDREANALYLSRQGDLGAAPMTVRTTSLTRQLATLPTGGTPPYRAVALDTRDALVEAMGFSRGRFVVQQEGYLQLVVPAWPEILRVAEDCRR